jgi:hypothetical protein
MNDDTQPKTPGRPFHSGDSRINRHGRPKYFDQFRKLAQQISHEKVIGPDGNTITRAEQLLRRWSQSRVPALQLAFAAYAFGRPPDKLEVDELQPRTRLILHYAHEFDRIEGINRAEALRREALRTGSQPPDDDNGASLRLNGP